VFHDRMVSPEDKAVVRDTLTAFITKCWGGVAEAVLAEPLLFGDYSSLAAQLAVANTENGDGDGGATERPAAAAPPAAARRRSTAGEAIAAAAGRSSAAGDVASAAVARPYEDVGDYSAIKPLFECLLGAYNAKAAKRMQLVFFEDALEHLTRICRTVALPHGNCLLVGVGGSGKSSLARLAAFTIGAQVFEITLTRGYDEAAFRDDLKVLYSILGAENKRVVFLFTDSHVADESFLELINNMLTSGTCLFWWDGAGSGTGQCMQQRLLIAIIILFHPQPTASDPTTNPK